jgi:hypothetical protein
MNYKKKIEFIEKYSEIYLGADKAIKNCKDKGKFFNPQTNKCVGKKSWKIIDKIIKNIKDLAPDLYNNIVGDNIEQPPIEPNEPTKPAITKPRPKKAVKNCSDENLKNITYTLGIKNSTKELAKFYNQIYDWGYKYKMDSEWINATIKIKALTNLFYHNYNPGKQHRLSLGKRLTYIYQLILKYPEAVKKIIDTNPRHITGKYYTIHYENCGMLGFEKYTPDNKGRLSYYHDMIKTCFLPMVYVFDFLSLIKDPKERDEIITALHEEYIIINPGPCLDNSCQMMTDAIELVEAKIKYGYKIQSFDFDPIRSKLVNMNNANQIFLSNACNKCKAIHPNNKKDKDDCFNQAMGTNNWNKTKLDYNRVINNLDQRLFYKKVKDGKIEFNDIQKFVKDYKDMFECDDIPFEKPKKKDMPRDDDINNVRGFFIAKRTRELMKGIPPQNLLKEMGQIRIKAADLWKKTIENPENDNFNRKEFDKMLKEADE